MNRVTRLHHYRDNLHKKFKGDDTINVGLVIAIADSHESAIDYLVTQDNLTILFEEVVGKYIFIGAQRSDGQCATYATDEVEVYVADSAIELSQ